MAKLNEGDVIEGIFALALETHLALDLIAGHVDVGTRRDIVATPTLAGRRPTTFTGLAAGCVFTLAKRVCLARQACGLSALILKLASDARQAERLSAGHLMPPAWARVACRLVNLT